MRMVKRIRLKKKYRLKVWLFFMLILIFFIAFIPHSNRAFLLNFFSKRCISYQQVYSNRLDDRIVDYIAGARLNGVESSSTGREILKKAAVGHLRRVIGGKLYVVDGLTNSYPYLTRDSKKLLNEIARRFRNSIEREGFKGSKFIVTSMTRTTESAKKLEKSNINTSENSPHLNGNAFDISYAHFLIRKFTVTECDKWYLKEALAEVIYKMKEEKKCWATYEKKQGCYHVVSR
jgi:hypothetical protein